MQEFGFWVALAGLAVAVPWLGMVTWARRRANHDLLVRGERAMARLTEVRHEGDETRQTRVTYRFAPRADQAEVTGQGVYASHLPLAAGDRVEVVYLPKLPAVSGLVAHLHRRHG